MDELQEQEIKRAGEALDKIVTPADLAQWFKTFYRAGYKQLVKLVWNKYGVMPA